ncbi:MAG: GyrI-like domain-containing protein [Clostridiales bacterium]|nr:GyrI-like domain-containing protein [Clostridiales bacterium]
MELHRCEKPAFAVIGREGSTLDGEGFVQRLWADANARFPEVEPLAKRMENGQPAGFWGAMTDMNRQFCPWEDNFTRGLYLAGVETELDAEPPAGWVKWIVPAFAYLYTEADQPDAFANGIAQLEQEQIPLAGAVQDFICPETGKSYLFFPISRL